MSELRIAMLGMVEGNGHPFSWSAIINGEYDRDAMAQCGYDAIPEYLGAQPPEALGIPGVRVTHVWCDEPGDADRVAKASCIADVVDSPTDVIGQVDAVVISTDIGDEHVDRARPFIEAGIPTFIDKPLTTNRDDLRQFIEWHDAGKPFMSTSCMRYAKELVDLRQRLSNVGEPRLVVSTMAKSLEKYGIHGIEAAYPFLRAGGYTSVRHSGSDEHNIVHVSHADGAELIIPVINDMYGGYGNVSVWGTEGGETAQFSDVFYAFKTQLEAFVEFARTGTTHVPFSETVEQMKILIGALISRDRGGDVIPLSDM